MQSVTYTFQKYNEDTTRQKHKIIMTTLSTKKPRDLAWQTMSIIPASLRHEDHEFEAILDYTVRSCFYKTKQKGKQEGPVWWCTPVNPALWGLRQQLTELKASLSYMVRHCLKIKIKQKPTKKKKKTGRKARAGKKSQANYSDHIARQKNIQSKE